MSAPDRATAEPSLTVNGETRALPGPCTLAELLERLGLARRRIAVAINRQVIPRSTYASQALAAGDQVEILEAVGGG